MKKIVLVLMVDGKVMSEIGDSVDESHILFMEEMASAFDEEYQKIKIRDGIKDDSFIGFDYQNEL